MSDKQPVRSNPSSGLRPHQGAYTDFRIALSAMESLLIATAMVVQVSVLMLPVGDILVSAASCILVGCVQLA